MQQHLHVQHASLCWFAVLFQSVIMEVFHHRITIEPVNARRGGTGNKEHKITAFKPSRSMTSCANALCVGYKSGASVMQGSRGSSNHFVIVSWRRKKGQRGRAAVLWRRVALGVGAVRDHTEPTSMTRHIDRVTSMISDAR